MAPDRQMSSFVCAVCETTLESWNTAWVPKYRLIVGGKNRCRSTVGVLIVTHDTLRAIAPGAAKLGRA